MWNSQFQEFQTYATIVTVNLKQRERNKNFRCRKFLQLQIKYMCEFNAREFINQEIFRWRKKKRKIINHTIEIINNYYNKKMDLM